MNKGRDRVRFFVNSSIIDNKEYRDLDEEKKLLPIENIVIGLENTSVSFFYENYEKWEDNFSSSFPEPVLPKDKMNFWILRNPFCNIASEIKWNQNGRPFNVVVEELVKLWNEYYQYYLEGEEKFVIFDKWFISEEYRRTLSEIAGLEFSDINLNVIHRTGEGSSFDMGKYQGAAQQMKVLDRHKQMPDSILLARVLQRPDVKELAEKWNDLCRRENIEQLTIK